MTQGELDFITHLIESNDADIDLFRWQFTYSTKDLTPSQKTMVYRAVKGLKAKGLIKLEKDW